MGGLRGQPAAFLHLILPCREERGVSKVFYVSECVIPIVDNVATFDFNFICQKAYIVYDNR